MILNDKQIIELCEQGMITPFLREKISRGVISYGLSSYGYDIRIAEKFKVFTNAYCSIVDPKNFDPRAMTDIISEDSVLIPPNSFALGMSVEYFQMPADVIGICVGKSTYARAGIVINVTPLECFDDQTEILTLHGWKKFDDLAENEIVATLNEDGVLEYHPIVVRQKRWYEGELIAIKGRSIDLLVTPEHRLYVRRQGKFDFELLRAGDLEGYYELEFKRDAFWLGENPEYFVLAALPTEKSASIRQVALQVFDALDKLKEATTPVLYARLEHPVPTYWTFRRLMTILTNIGAVERYRVHSAEGRSTGAAHFWKYRLKNRMEDFGLLEPIAVPIEAWVKFFGLWLAEGSAFVSRKGDYIVKVASLATNTKQQAREILKELPFKWHETPSGFATVSKQLCMYLMQFGHAHEKYIPVEIKRLSPSLLRKFLWGYMLGDGNFSTFTATTSSKRLVDDLQEIGLKVGWPVSYWKSVDQGTPVHSNPQYTSNHTVFKVGFSRDGTPRHGRAEGAWSRVPYKGFVYDVTVPPNHTIYVRRNGKAVWSGNCGWRGYLTIEISNTTPLPARIYVGEGIAQVIFLRGEPCLHTYAGKYQNQEDIVPARV